MVCRRYRPRQPRVSPLWQVMKDHWQAWQVRREAGQLAKCGPLPAHLPTAATAFLRCGDLHAGFTRLRCPDCQHEYLLAFTCKQRGLCAACHQRRALITPTEPVQAVTPGSLAFASQRPFPLNPNPANRE